ncbi:hypothetical protein CLF_112979 [Clonorchis sinensis]|uniref:Protein phosphatase inhibitor 2 n=1 Tax=Clonorchis sinensis TaxID=79923 RepID=G7YXE1_CLOSI|nr:hypothetical protein CLF_112979 [Clonorchis sinensis]
MHRFACILADNLLSAEIFFSYIYAGLNFCWEIVLTNPYNVPARTQWVAAPRAIRDPEPVDPAELEHQRQFREKRRLHYNEFVAAKMAQETLNPEETSSDDSELERAAEEAARNARLNAGRSRQVPLTDSSPANPNNRREKQNNATGKRS